MLRSGGGVVVGRLRAPHSPQAPPLPAAGEIWWVGVILMTDIGVADGVTGVQSGDVPARKRLAYCDRNGGRRR